MKYPKIVVVNGREYKINTDFRVALECDRIARDESIDDMERALGIICTLYGEEALNNSEDTEELIKLAVKFLTCGKEQPSKSEKRDMDYQQDMDYIEASFMSDYHIDLENTEMHWWKFNKLMEGLSNSEEGNCCILNRIRNIRNMDVRKIEDSKTRSEAIEIQKKFALKENEPRLTKEQEQSMEELNSLIGL